MWYSHLVIFGFQFAELSQAPLGHDPRSVAIFYPRSVYIARLHPRRPPLQSF